MNCQRELKSILKFRLLKLNGIEDWNDYCKSKDSMLLFPIPYPFPVNTSVPVFEAPLYLFLYLYSWFDTEF